MIHLAKPEDIARDTVVIDELPLKVNDTAATYVVWYREPHITVRLTPKALSHEEAEDHMTHMRRLVAHLIEEGRAEGLLLSK